MKLYIAVLDEFPDHMTPTLVAHAVLGAHMKFIEVNTLEGCKSCAVVCPREETGK